MINVCLKKQTSKLNNLKSISARGENIFVLVYLGGLLGKKKTFSLQSLQTDINYIETLSRSVLDQMGFHLSLV